MPCKRVQPRTAAEYDTFCTKGHCNSCVAKVHAWGTALTRPTQQHTPAGAGCALEGLAARRLLRLAPCECNEREQGRGGSMQKRQHGSWG